MSLSLQVSVCTAASTGYFVWQVSLPCTWKWVIMMNGKMFCVMKPMHTTLNVLLYRRMQTLLNVQYILFIFVMELI